MGVSEVKVVDKLTESGKRIYGVQYKDGHVVWKLSLPEAYYAYMKASKTQKNR